MDGGGVWKDMASVYDQWLGNGLDWANNKMHNTFFSREFVHWISFK